MFFVNLFFNVKHKLNPYHHIFIIFLALNFTTEFISFI